MAWPGKDRARARSALIALAALCAVQASCAETTPVEFSIRASDEENPLRGATSVSIGLERSRLLMSETEAFYPPDAEYLELPRAPLGPAYRFRLGVYDDTILLARARSLEFEVSELGIIGSTGVFIAPVGRFVSRALPFPAAPRAAVPSPLGLIAALEDGSVVELRVHEPDPISPILPRGSALEAWAIGDRLLIRLGDERVALMGREGIVDVIQDRRLRSHLLASALYDEAGGHVYLIGGARGSRRISRLPISGETFGELEALADLDRSREHAEALLLRALDGSIAIAIAGGFDERGRFQDDLLALDLAGGAHLKIDMPEGCSLFGATVTQGEYMQLLVAGGRRDESVSDEVQLLILNPRAEPHLELITPAPAPLHIARERARSLSWASGLHLIYGGFNAAGEYEPRAELVDLREIPGSTAPTGALPPGLEPTIALLLGDGSIFISDGDQSAGYTPPRAYD